MRHLLNTLYVTDPLMYLSLENENIVVWSKGEAVGKFPLHLFQSIVCFGCKGISPALMGKCVDSNIYISLHNLHGGFEASIIGNIPGNVILRRSQYRLADDASSLEVAKDMILAKLLNQRAVLRRYKRDYEVSEQFCTSICGIDNCLNLISSVNNKLELIGVEGKAADFYFNSFNEMIRQKIDKPFIGRNRRPPLDPINAMLSFFYTIMASEIASACLSVGLDPYVGMLHCDRSGRRSLALDLEEEMRAYFVDRFVVSQFNRRQIKSQDFEYDFSGACLINDTARKKMLSNWQKRKQQLILHPYLNEKIEIGLIPYVQANLLARFIRGEINRYPAFLWK